MQIKLKTFFPVFDHLLSKAIFFYLSLPFSKALKGKTKEWQKPVKAYSNLPDFLYNVVYLSL